MEFSEIIRKIDKFNRERGWDVTHTGERVLIALMTEVGELAEIYKWRPQGKPLSKEEKSSLERELADIFIYLACIALTEGIDLESGVLEKIGINRGKYPISEAQKEWEK